MIVTHVVTSRRRHGDGTATRAGTSEQWPTRHEHDDVSRISVLRTTLEMIVEGGRTLGCAGWAAARPACSTVKPYTLAPLAARRRGTAPECVSVCVGDAAIASAAAARHHVSSTKGAFLKANGSRVGAGPGHRYDQSRCPGALIGLSRLGFTLKPRRGRTYCMLNFIIISIG